MVEVHANLNSDERMKHLDILNIYKNKLFYLGLLNLQHRHVDHVSGMSILTNLWKQQTCCNFLKPKSKIAS